MMPAGASLKVLGFSIFILAVSNYAAATGVNISIYSINVDGFKEIEVKFNKVIVTAAEQYCEKNCGDDFKNSSSYLTAVFSNITNVKPNVNVTVIIQQDGQTNWSRKRTQEMFASKRKEINSETGHQIVSVDEKFYGIAPDNPNNWIILAIFLVLTLVLLLVVLYLSKHKVNHAEEHYEQMKGENGTDGEVAA